MEMKFVYNIYKNNLSILVCFSFFIQIVHFLPLLYYIINRVRISASKQLHRFLLCHNLT